MTHEQEIFEVVWPRGERVAQVGTYAKRFDSLQGKTIGELWDWVFRGDEIFPLIEEELANRYPGIKFVSYKAFGSIHGGNEAEAIIHLSETLKQNKCDAVISGVGC